MANLCDHSQDAIVTKNPPALKQCWRATKAKIDVLTASVNLLLELQRSISKITQSRCVSSAAIQYPSGTPSGMAYFTLYQTAYLYANI